jgi:calcium binding protein 39
MTMANESLTSKPIAAPFEWLAGGLFFGKSKGGIESIDSCKDVSSLLKGIEENLADISAGGAPAYSNANTSSATTVPAERQPEGNSTLTTPSQFLAARIARLRFLLYDERRLSSQQESCWSTPAVAAAVLKGLTSTPLLELMPNLLEHMCALPFESRKHVTAVFAYLLVSGLDGSDAALYLPIMEDFRSYVEAEYDRLMHIIVSGHDVAKHGASDVCLHYGTMYRSFLRHPSLYQLLVGTTARAERYVYPFLDSYVHLPNFEVSSDAMESLRLVFTAGGDRVGTEASQPMADLVADFFTRDYVAIFDERFNPKLLSDTANYMTRRVALQILSTLLLTRSNYNVMIQYVASRENLMLVMKLLRDNSPHITWDAFHVFKVFVANPNKPQEVIKILRDNQVKLCRYLTTLHQDKEENDTQFRDEKALIITTIEAL